MKQTIYFPLLLVPIVFLISCNNCIKSDSSSKENITTDSVNSNKILVNEDETFIKKNKPFRINGIEKYPNHWAGYNLEQTKSDYEKKNQSFKK